jgi:hypothetical protein
MPTRYHIRLPDPAQARGDIPELAFHAHSAQGMAEELQAALRTRDLFDRWCARQENPDDIDPALGTTDPNAVVSGEQQDLHIDLTVDTTLPSTLLRQRLNLLAGPHWQLRDVTTV